jgi:hypothetical protein
MGNELHNRNPASRAQPTEKIVRPIPQPANRPLVTTQAWERFSAVDFSVRDNYRIQRQGCATGSRQNVRRAGKIRRDESHERQATFDECFEYNDHLRANFGGWPIQA